MERPCLTHFFCLKKGQARITSFKRVTTFWFFHIFIYRKPKPLPAFEIFQCPPCCIMGNEEAYKSCFREVPVAYKKFSDCLVEEFRGDAINYAFTGIGTNENTVF